MQQWLEDFQSQVHNRSKEAENWRISVGIGSQDCLSKAFQTLVDDGDPVLMESPAYSYAEGWARVAVPDIKQKEELAKADARCFSRLSSPFLCCLAHTLVVIVLLQWYPRSHYAYGPGARR